MNDCYKEGYAHVIFPLEQEPSGYPGFGAERVWVKKIGQNQFQIENIPFYIKGISCGDIVEAKEISEDVYEFVKLKKHSGHSTFRIFISDDTPDKENVLQDVIKELNFMGAETEGVGWSTLTAIAISPDVDVLKVIQYLNNKHKAGLLDYEEANISNAYLSPKN